MFHTTIIITTGPLITSCHVSDVVRSHSTALGGGKYSCNLCQITARDKYNMRRHLETTHDLSTGYQCELCRKQFKAKHQLTVHKARGCGVSLPPFWLGISLKVSWFLGLSQTVCAKILKKKHSRNDGKPSFYQITWNKSKLLTLTRGNTSNVSLYE